MEKNLVSVVIACYNGEKYIDKCLNSITNQSYQNIQILICDDASTDNSYSILKNWQSIDPRIILLRNSDNKHSAASRNSCIEISSGKYILIQDIDDYSSHNRIELLVQSLYLNKVDFVSSSMFIIDENGTIKNNKILKHKKFPNKYDFICNISFNHPATLFLKSVLLKVNGYRVAEETKGSEDYDLFMRLYAIGAKGMNISDPLYYYRTNAANYKVLKLNNRLNECKIRFKGFKKLNILHLGFPMVIKPLIVFFIKKYLKINPKI